MHRVRFGKKNKLPQALFRCIFMKQVGVQNASKFMVSLQPNLWELIAGSDKKINRSGDLNFFYFADDVQQNHGADNRGNQRAKDVCCGHP